MVTEADLGFGGHPMEDVCVCERTTQPIRSTKRQPKPISDCDLTCVPVMNGEQGTIEFTLYADLNKTSVPDSGDLGPDEL